MLRKKLITNFQGKTYELDSAWDRQCVLEMREGC